MEFISRHNLREMYKLSNFEYKQFLRGFSFRCCNAVKYFYNFKLETFFPSSFISLYFLTHKTIMVLLQTLSYRKQFIRNILTRVNNLIIQPSSHPTIQPSNRSTIQPSNHPTIESFNC